MQPDEILNNLVVDQLDSSLNDLYYLFSNINFDTRKGFCWPYWISSENRGTTINSSMAISNENAWPSKLISQSTNSMIVASILGSMVQSNNRSASSYKWGPIFKREDAYPPDHLIDRIDKTLNLLSANWNNAKKRKKESRGEIIFSNSDTYGSNDILTLSWHLDIFELIQRIPIFQKHIENFSKIASDIEKIIWSRVKQYAGAKSNYLALCAGFNAGGGDGANLVGDSTYILIRFARVLKRIQNHNLKKLGNLEPTLARAADSFQSTLHEHLSYSEITDSRFDPAELAFCLEGMLLIRPERVDDHLASRVFSVMERAQKSMPYWRTETPMIVTQKGQLLFPISVEAASSLLYSLSILEGQNVGYRRWDHLAPDFAASLQRFWHWLRARRISININDCKVSGWHSRHIANPIIHTWETSQVTEFIVAFRDQMLRLKSETELNEIGLNAQFVSAEMDNWNDIVSKYEGSIGIEGSFDSYSQIGKDFVLPLQRDEMPFRSFLLYGPPGTGKTSLAKQVAAQLGIPFIYLTVSDFVDEGESKIELKAKNIFSALQKQPMSLVFFDEFDQFILDRDSDQFKDLATVFKFLTPGMLTKIADLYESNSLLFAIATNYEERIDKAITRPGRIDKKYLVVPPSRDRRIKMIGGILRSMDIKFKPSSSQLDKLKKYSIFLGFKDISNILKTVLASKQNNTLNKDEYIKIHDHMLGSPRSIQFSSYLDGRFKISNDKPVISNGPLEEFTYLISLAFEVFGDNYNDWLTISPDFLSVFKELYGKCDDNNKKKLLSKISTEDGNSITQNILRVD